MNATSGSLGLAFESHQQFHRVPGFRPAVEYVADNYEVRLATDPRKIIVKNPRFRERTDHGTVIAMNIRDGNNPIDIINARLVRPRRSRRCQRSQQKK